MKVFVEVNMNMETRVYMTDERYTNLVDCSGSVESQGLCPPFLPVYNEKEDTHTCPTCGLTDDSCFFPNVPVEYLTRELLEIGPVSKNYTGRIKHDGKHERQ